MIRSSGFGHLSRRAEPALGDVTGKSVSFLMNVCLFTNTGFYSMIESCGLCLLP